MLSCRYLNPIECPALCSVEMLLIKLSPAALTFNSKPAAKKLANGKCLQVSASRYPLKGKRLSKYNTLGSVAPRLRTADLESRPSTHICPQASLLCFSCSLPSSLMNPSFPLPSLCSVSFLFSVSFSSLPTTCRPLRFLILSPFPSFNCWIFRFPA